MCVILWRSLKLTRINLLNVEFLTNQHLLAEHREIKRIPNVIKSGKYNLDNIPSSYTMGTGHVKFFYNKLKYLYERYEYIHRECLNRGFDVTYYGECFDNLPSELYNDYEPTFQECFISLQRINEKIAENPKFYKGGSININTVRLTQNQ